MRLVRTTKRPATKRLDAAGNPHMIRFEIVAPKHTWFPLWEGVVCFKSLPTTSIPFGSLECVDYPKYAFSRSHLERRLEARAQEILGFNDRTLHVAPEQRDAEVLE